MPDIATHPELPTWTLGDRLRKAREFAGLDQGELAERIGISRGTVGNYELGHGVRRPKPVVINAWAAVTGVPLSWLTDMEEEAGRDSRRYSDTLVAA